MVSVIMESSALGEVMKRGDHAGGFRRGLRGARDSGANRATAIWLRRYCAVRAASMPAPRLAGCGAPARKMAAGVAARARFVAVHCADTRRVRRHRKSARPRSRT